jgi:hypothetical protein
VRRDRYINSMGIRHIVIPPDVVAVQRRSPVLIRKRTPWHPQPDGEVPTDRAGGREWFSDKLFVESQNNHARSGYSASVIGHCIAAAVLVVVIVTRPVPMVRVGDGRSPMVMPASFSTLPVATSGVRPATAERTAPKPERIAAPAPPPPPPGVSAPAPV